MTTRFVHAPRPAVIGALAVGLCVTGCGAGGGSVGTAGTPGTAGTTASSTPGPTTAGSSSTAGAGSTGTVSQTAATARTSSGLVPLWPFTTLAEARAWQAAYRSGGSQPWHLDAGQTALAFTRGHLGYTDVDRVTSHRIQDGDAHIGVGWRVSGQSRTHSVAVLHLVRLGSGSDAPWVVVGSDDTVLSLTTPRYGSAVTSPLRVGGRITGVDESLRVLVLGSRSATPLFASPGLPAGGERTPWSTTVRFRAPHGSVLTIAVSTGGHLTRVEDFALTAVRAS
jgi:hypothetical protein